MGNLKTVVKDRKKDKNKKWGEVAG